MHWCGLKSLFAIYACAPSKEIVFTLAFNAARHDRGFVEWNLGIDCEFHF